MKIYMVGGAVRDKLLGREPKDRDWVIVGARADDVEHLLEQGFSQVGADFPVFLHPDTGEEYALARVERKVGVGYHGFVVEADSSVTIEDDLARRDLTINSMAESADGVLVDPYGGLRDLHNRVLRHTTKAFVEDPLRVLRLARFAARYHDFTIAEETIELCQELCSSNELNHLSHERIWVELEKGFNEASPLHFIQVLEQTGALKYCELIRALFGQKLQNPQLSLARTLQAATNGHRFPVALAVLSTAGVNELPGIANRVRECIANVNSLRSAKRTCVDLHRLLKQTKALSGGDAFYDLLSACIVLESAGFKPIFSSRHLAIAKEVMKDVNASMFPNLAGKELGVAIDAQRIKNLHLATDIPQTQVE